MNAIKNLAVALLLCVAPPVLSQQAANGLDSAPSNRQVFAMGLYPPDVIMRHQQKLGVTDDQRANMSQAIKAFQADVGELQWTLQNEQQKLQQSLSGYRIDSGQALAHAERVLELESQFKLAHFKLLFAIKNELTEAQIDMIRERLRQRRDNAP
jgi:Spy/CpxP family protein refolding chaperone